MLGSQDTFSKGMSLPQERDHHRPMDLTYSYGLPGPACLFGWSLPIYKHRKDRIEGLVLHHISRAGDKMENESPWPRYLLGEGGIHLGVGMSETEQRHDRPTALIRFPKCWLMTRHAISTPMQLAADECLITLCSAWTNFRPPEVLHTGSRSLPFQGRLSKWVMLHRWTQDSIFKQADQGKPTPGCRHTLS